MNATQDKQPVKKMSIIVSRGSLDGIYPALIMANGARMEGIEASLFFTFFGLNGLAKKTMDHVQVATVGNSALNMAMPMLGLPITMPFPTWMGALPGVSAFATGLMNKEMARLDVPPLREFLEMISDSGGRRTVPPWGRRDVAGFRKTSGSEGTSLPSSFACAK